ncbi:MAG: ACT domain-containing protein [Planctomycetota bacterium]|jgi:hypothetical protein
MISIQPQFSIFLINKPGVLASVTTAMAKEHINISALTMTDSVEHGVLRVVVDKPDRARTLLGRAHDHWTETDVIVLDLANQPGTFAKVARGLADAHISIAYAYITGGSSRGRSRAVFKVADMKKAIKVLDDLMPTPKHAKKQTRKTRTGTKGSGA